MSSGRLPEVVVYERFQCKALTENIFGVLGRWSPTGGGGTRRFIQNSVGFGRDQAALWGKSREVLKA